MKCTLLCSKLAAILLLVSVVVISCTPEEVNPIQPTAYSYFGDIKSDVDAFRDLLGANNINYIGAKPAGRREINWDALPDSVAAPNGYEGDFFNKLANRQVRGIEFTTPGSALSVSADHDNPTNTPVLFGNINPTYTSIFPSYSGERLFSPIGSNRVDAYFYLPGTNTPAVVNAIGVVFIDVDREGASSIEIFDKDDKSLGTFSAPVMNEGQAFLGLVYETPLIHHIRIRLGNTPLGPNDGTSKDVSVMDDIIFAEPQPVQ
jgi:hypothetical protein